MKFIDWTRFLPVCVAICAAPSAAQDPIRRWDFEEGRWNLAKNSAPVFPGRLGRHGGPLGSLFIPSISAYGQDMDDQMRNGYEPREPNAIQPEWTDGRAPGFVALRLGTRTDGPYGSGLTGDEFTNGFTFTGWVRLRSGVDGGAAVLHMGDAWKSGFIILAEVRKWCPHGRLAARFAALDEEGKPRPIAIYSKSFEPDVWHFFAVAWDGAALRIDIDGATAAETNGLKRCFPPIAYSRSYANASAFFEEASNVSRNRFSVGGKSSLPLDVDEIAVFDRALSPEELVAVRGADAAGTPEEQKSAAAAQEARRARTARCKLEIPRDTGGYFRIGEAIPATVSVPEDCAADGPFTAEFRLWELGETGKRGDLEIATALDKGEAVSRPPEEFGDLEIATPLVRSRTFAAGEVVREDFAPPRCGVYYLDMEIRDRNGAVVKRCKEPWCIGVVPPRPATIDSPYGYWATEDSFSHDSNLRRLACYANNLDITTNQVRIFREKQRISDSELRLFAWLSIRSTKEMALSEEQMEKQRKEIWPKQIALMKKLGVKEFEVTSEQNNSCSPEAYAQQLKELIPMVKAEIPDAVFYPAGASPGNGVEWTEKVLANGCAEIVDGVSFHPYTGTPLASWHKGYGGTKFRDMAAAAIPGKPIYCTEVGEHCLPRVQGRPMTADEANRGPYPSPQGTPPHWATYMPLYTEADAAAISCHTVLLTLAVGYEFAVQCQHAMLGALPSLVSVARTALSGQVLNHIDGHPQMLPTASMQSAAILVRRKDGSRVVAVFGTADEPISFLAEPGRKFRTMDLYGNYGEIETPADGLLTLVARLAPTYLFDVPEDFAPVSPVRIEAPETLGKDGVMDATVCVTNLFGTPLAGGLGVSIAPDRGAAVAPQTTVLSLAPGEATNVAVRVDGAALKRGDYTLRAELDRGGDVAPLVAEMMFRFEGVEQALPLLSGDFPLDGDAGKWLGVHALVSDVEADVSLGKPDPARPWDPQWTGPDDLSLKVRAGWTQSGEVRFLLEVTDDAFLPAPPEKAGQPWLWDCLELFVDTRTHGMLGSAKRTAGADQILVVPDGASWGHGLPARDAAPSVPCTVIYPTGDDRRVDVECVGRRTGTGWLVEGCIVPRGTCALSFGPGARLALDFLVDDCDTPETPRKAAMAIHGHVGNNSDPSAWGRYRLVKQIMNCQ